MDTDPTITILQRGETEAMGLRRFIAEASELSDSEAAQAIDHPPVILPPRTFWQWLRRR